jgi:hypothetical protein
VALGTTLAGCSDGGDGDDSGNGDGGDTTGNTGGTNLFGSAAQIEGDTTPIDGSVESNVLSGFEVVAHVGVFSQANGSAIVSARIENVGSETVRLIDRHTQRTILYGPDGQEIEEIGSLRTDTEGQEIDGVPPGETGIMNFSSSNGYTPADIGRYGIVLDCRDESSREEARSPYCPEV